MDEITEADQNQKLSFKLSGGVSGEYPLDLRSTAEFLIYFQHLIDKSYCVLTGREKTSVKSKQEYQILVKNLSVGSLEAELLLAMQGLPLFLPIIGLANPKTIWEYVCYALEFYKTYAAAKQNNVATKIEINPNNHSKVTLNLHVGDVIHAYPKEVLPIASKSVPVYRKMSSAMEKGNFDNFIASSLNNTNSTLAIKQSDKSLFSDNNIIHDNTILVDADIIDFNKESMTGKVRVLSGDLENREISFSIIGNQNSTEYIKSMNESKVKLTALAEVKQTTLESKVIRLHILNIKNSF